MKRNHLPDDPDELQEEQAIIISRLDELFFQQTKQVSILNKGYWLRDKRHVKLDSTKGIGQEYISYSKSLGYYFLNPFESLYHLETRQIIIFFNGLPLSLVEGYQLMISNPLEFKNYLVFQKLNRTGYICLRPDNIDPPLQQNKSTAEESGESKNSPLLEAVEKDLKSLFEIDTIYLPFSQVLTSLRANGPREYQPDDCVEPKNIRPIHFEVYKRETFIKNKPRKGQTGKPDYRLIVCDKYREKTPNIKQLSQYNSTKGEVSNSTCKIIFAIVDDDTSVCFTHFSPLETKTITLF